MAASLLFVVSALSCDAFVRTEARSVPNPSARGGTYADAGAGASGQLELVGQTLVLDRRLVQAEGLLTNHSLRMLEHATLRSAMTGRSGRRLGTAHGSISLVPPGKTVRFHVTGYLEAEPGIGEMVDGQTRLVDFRWARSSI